MENRLKDEALALPSEERAELAYLLLQSLGEDTTQDDEWESQWVTELDRRAAEVRSGQAVGLPAEQVFEDLRNKLT